MDPGLEPVRLPQVRDPTPGEDEGVLQRVLGERRVAQDPLGDRVERIADLVHQDGERLAISPTGLLDQVSIHLDLRSPRPRWPRTTHYDGRVEARTFRRCGRVSRRRSSSGARGGRRPATARCASWPSRCWTPIRRNPTRSWRARLAALSARTPGEERPEAGGLRGRDERLEERPTDASAASLGRDVDALPRDAAVDLARRVAAERRPADDRRHPASALACDEPALGGCERSKWSQSGASRSSVASPVAIPSA